MIKNWNDIKTAYYIGRTGTITEAANLLGVHRATVIRQLDSLEAELGQKLFLRHSKGYTLTDAGKILMTSAQVAEQELTRTVDMIKSESSMLSGELIITSIERAFGFLSIPLKAFLLEHPNIQLRYEASVRNFKLEYGEAHIAIRAGNKPEDLDYVVQPFGEVKLAFYASKSYCSKFGLPKDEKDFHKHKFVVSETSVMPSFDDWQQSIIPTSCVSLFSHEHSILEDAVISGIGIGLLSETKARFNSSLIEVMPNKPEMTIPIWMVTHVDQHRSPKVQACLKHLKKWIEENNPY